MYNCILIQFYLHNQAMVSQMPDVVHTNYIPGGDRRLENGLGEADGEYPSQNNVSYFSFSCACSYFGYHLN